MRAPSRAAAIRIARNGLRLPAPQPVALGALCCAALLLLPCARPLPAQTPAATPAPNAEPSGTATGDSTETLTLHVYAAHVQMPAMVLTPALHTVRALPAERFRLRLDGGAPFPPTSVRLQGDDPIAFSVLVDLGGDENLLLTQLAPALVQLRTRALRPHDTLTLFAVDCHIVRYTGLVPDDAPGVEHAVQVVLGNPLLHKGRLRPTCGSSLRLWDAMAGAMQDLAEQPARRVLLALTAGVDQVNPTGWMALRSYATGHSIALFATTAPDSFDAARIGHTPLPGLCALTGGVLLPLNSAGELTEQVDQLVALLRERYILEFPRSSHLSPGSHEVAVEVPRLGAMVRITGLSMPLLDPRLRDDPHTVPYLEADKPAVGTRHNVPSAPPP